MVLVGIKTEGIYKIGVEMKDIFICVPVMDHRFHEALDGKRTPLTNIELNIINPALDSHPSDIVNHHRIDNIYQKIVLNGIGIL